MARQESQSKLLYYPTPLSVVDTIASWISGTDEFVRLADPCVGEGLALRRLTDALSLPKRETWGVELSYSRAEIAKQVIDSVLPTSFEAATWGPKSVSLLFNNPPYDWSDKVDEKNKRLRHEVIFGTKASHKLVTGGVHILIVPQWILKNESLARHWMAWYRDINVFRFPDGEFEAFDQVIVMGALQKAYIAPNKEQLEWFMGLGSAQLEPIPQGAGQYQLPKAPAFAVFKYTPVNFEQIAALARDVNLLANPDWERMAYVRPAGSPIFPLTQLKIGHLSMVISAGELGVVPIELPEGRALVKGTIDKVRERTAEDIIDNDGRVKGQRVEVNERPMSVISVLYADGRRELISGPEQVADFITQNAGPLADAVLEKNQPFYDWKPTLEEWRRASKAALGLPPLPGRIERGLFDVQKHFAIAAARFMRGGNRFMARVNPESVNVGWKHVLVNAEMGFGKTSTAAAASEQLDKWPILVMCPGHMVHKWRRDLEAASDLEDPIKARIITKPARAERSWLHSQIIPILAEYGLDASAIHHDERWQVPPLGDKDNGLRRKLRIKCDPRHMRRLGEALLARVQVRGFKEYRPRWASSIHGGISIEFMDRDEYTLSDFFNDYDFGRLGKKAAAVVAFEPAKYDAGIKPIGLPRRYIRMWHSEKDRYMWVKAQTCPGCGKPFGAAWKAERWETDLPVSWLDNKGKICELIDVEVPDICPHFEEEPMLKEDGSPMLHGDGSPVMAIRRCGGARVTNGKLVGGTRLYEMARWRRVGLSRLVQRQYAHRFQLYIADEVHEGKSASTDIGTADGRFISSIEHSVALTGTMFGGVSSSLFSLYFRRNPEVRRHYKYKDSSTWVDHFGNWKYRWSEKEANRYYSRGASSGIERWDVRPPQELPGVSPAVVRYLLPITLFGKITDLGYTLPPLRDRVEAVDMGEELEVHYKAVNKYLLDEALARIKQDKDSSLLSAWFTTVRYRPMSAFRDEVVTSKGEHIMALPSVVGISAEEARSTGLIKHLESRAGFRPDPELFALPKEWRLANLVAQNRDRGRKTLVFVEQTGERDIRDRLSAILGKIASNVRVETLSSTDMKPAKREMWIAKNAPMIDVLLVNPGLVKTGLDLVMFSDIAFYETNTSLYTVWQAMRRVWRLGQKNDVSTSFLAYNETMEAHLLDLMGKKMKAAMLLYGDSAAGALIETDTDDLAREIIRKALEGKTIESAGSINGKSLFATGDEHEILVSNSPMGSVIAHTPTLVTIEHAPLPEPEPIVLADLAQFSLFGDMVAVQPVKRRR